MMERLRRMFCIHRSTYSETTIDTFPSGIHHETETYWECLSCGASSGKKDPTQGDST